jgi:hypothetical protein
MEASTKLGDLVSDYTIMTTKVSSIQFGFYKWLIAYITIKPIPQHWLDIMLCDFFYTCASIYACCSVDRHIVALEEDKEVFSALVSPLMHSHYKKFWAIATPMA